MIPPVTLYRNKMILVFTNELCLSFSPLRLYTWYEPVTGNKVFADTLRVTDEQIAIIAAEELHELIIG